MNNSKLVFYDFNWQALRVSLSFENEASTRMSLLKVMNYIESDFKKEGKLSIDKVYRVLNLLTATHMGFCGQRKLIKDNKKLDDLEQRDKIVLHNRDKLSELYNDLKSKQSFTLLNEDSLKKQLIIGSTEDFQKVYASLIFRYENSSRSQHREELKWYLLLMRDVLLRCREDKDQITNYVTKFISKLTKRKRASAQDWITTKALVI